MSKKETEFDRYDRMKRMEKEQGFQKEQQKRKDSIHSEEVRHKKGAKQKSPNTGRKSWLLESDETEDFGL